MSVNIWQHALLAFLLILWCVLHSTLISGKISDSTKSLLAAFSNYYRILYNGFASITLLPILYLMFTIPATPIFMWPGHSKIIQGFLMGSGIIIMFTGAKSYDMKQFLGLRQLTSQHNGPGLAERGKLNTSGTLRIIRHPWYTTGLLLLWARNITTVSLIVNIVLSAYLVIGAFMEEKRLTQEFGLEYVAYQKKVGMFLPKI